MNKGNTKHGMRSQSSTHPLYNVWRGMKARCYNKNHDHYKYYGERGISVCDRWRDSFEMFFEWSLNSGYVKNLTIDRINVNGNYEPENCRWATLKEQSNNRRNVRKITYMGEAKSAVEWAVCLGIPYRSLMQRLSKNWNLDKAFSIKKFKKGDLK